MLRLSRQPEGEDYEDEDEDDDFSEIMHRSRLKLSLEDREVPGSSPRSLSRDRSSRDAIQAGSPLPSEEEDVRPLGRRLAPLGQDKEDEEAEIERADLASKVRKMEEEQEEMG